MPLTPITVMLTDGQKLDALKRIRKRYGDEMITVENQLTDILTSIAEAEYLVQFVGEQPEVKDLKNRKPEIDALELRRQYLGKLIDRLDSVIPTQPEVHNPLSGSSAAGAPRRRF